MTDYSQKSLHSLACKISFINKILFLYKYNHFSSSYKGLMIRTLFPLWLTIEDGVMQP